MQWSGYIDKIQKSIKGHLKRTELDGCLCQKTSITVIPQEKSSSTQKIQRTTVQMENAFIIKSGLIPRKSFSFPIQWFHFPHRHCRRNLGSTPEIPVPTLAQVDVQCLPLCQACPFLVLTLFKYCTYRKMNFKASWIPWSYNSSVPDSPLFLL